MHVDDTKITRETIQCLSMTRRIQNTEFHTTIHVHVNDPEVSLSTMSNTINKKPCKNTTQAGTNHKILLNSFFYTKILIFITFFYQKYIFTVILFSKLYNTKI